MQKVKDNIMGCTCNCRNMFMQRDLSLNGAERVRTPACLGVQGAVRCAVAVADGIEACCADGRVANVDEYALVFSALGFIFCPQSCHARSPLLAVLGSALLARQTDNKQWVCFGP